MNLESRFPVSATLILAVVAAGIFSARRPFHSHRPPAPVQVPGFAAGTMQVPARLWEDPLHALATRPAQGAGGAGGAVPADRLQLELAARCARPHRSETPAPDQRASLRVHVLPVLLPGRRLAENRESRRRARYAVHAGLATAGFLPESTDTIGRLEVQLDARPAADPAPPEWRTRPVAPAVTQVKQTRIPLRGSDLEHPVYDAQPGRRLVAGFEWLKGVRGDSVLVLWLDSDEVLPTASFRGLADLLEALGPGSCPAGSCRVTVIGPRTSDKLKALVGIYTPRGAADDDPSGLHQLRALRASCGLRFVSPTATIDHVEIGTIDAANDAVQVFEHVRGGDPAKPDVDALAIHRTTLSDRDLMTALIAELRRREIDCGQDAAVRVALISEFDTLYARAMRATFIAALDGATRDGDVRAREVPDPSRWLSEFSYLRGLDGALEHADKGDKDDAHGEAKRTAAPTITDALSHSAHLDEPTGTSQWDYIRRLAWRMRAELPAGQRYGAIGILGSDFYDKQLVVQALRPLFPGVVFFTTDLDAGWCQAEDYDLYRNLLIASSFHFQLSADLQETAPPFRDTYQSAIFLATRFALGKEQVELPREPLLFEIARSGPYWLNRSATATGVHPCPTALPAHLAAVWPHLAVLLVIAVLAVRYLARHWVLERRARGATTEAYWSRGALTFLALLLVTAGIAVADGLRAEGEPLTLFEGVSVWPSVLIRVAVMFLALQSICTLRRHQDRSRKAMQLEWRLPATSTLDDVAPPAPSGQGGPLSIHAVWRHYTANLDRQPTRALVGCIVLCLGSYLAVYIDQFPISPARGTIAWLLDYATAAGAVFLVFLVWCHSIEAIRNTLTVIRCMRGPDIAWSDSSPASDDLARASSQARATRFLGQLTDVPMQAMVSPFLLMFLLVCSAYPVFDLWHVTVLETILMLVFAALLFVAAVILRFAVEGNRRESLRRVQRLRDRRQPGVPPDRFDELLDEITENHEGAFAGVAQNPILRAVSIPVGGLGGLAVLERIAESL